MTADKDRDETKDAASSGKGDAGQARQESSSKPAASKPSAAADASSDQAADSEGAQAPTGDAASEEGAAADLATKDASDQGAGADSESKSEAEADFRYVHSDNLPALLEALGITLMITTYQAGKLVAFRAREGRVSMLLRTFDKAMGLAVDARRMAIATNHHVWMLQNSPEIATKMEPKGTHDACFLPRFAYVSGCLDFHEMAWGRDELWIVNTLFSCICTLHPEHSFIPRWRPPFVTELNRQDRCHMNGMAVVDGIPKYVTAFGETNTPEGWRPGKVDGGILMEVPSGKIIARGLSMPHSPRVYMDKLWVLDSGRGRLTTVDRETGEITPVADLPGYTRGLSFIGPFAFIGLSKIRETAVFGGVPIAENMEDRKCGVYVVDLRNGETVAFIEFEGTVEEVFDVQVLPGIRNPAVVGLQKKTIQRACVIGPETALPTP